MTELSKTEKSLYEAILQIDTLELCLCFFNDICTPAERQALCDRWLVAQLLDEGQLSYRQIHEETSVSIATITRVARFLRHERHSGYKKMLEKIKKK